MASVVRECVDCVCAVGVCVYVEFVYVFCVCVYTVCVCCVPFCDCAWQMLLRRKHKVAQEVSVLIRLILHTHTPHHTHSWAIRCWWVWRRYSLICLGQTTRGETRPPHKNFVCFVCLCNLSSFPCLPLPAPLCCLSPLLSLNSFFFWLITKRISAAATEIESSSEGRLSLCLCRCLCHCSGSSGSASATAKLLSCLEGCPSRNSLDIDIKTTGGHRLCSCCCCSSFCLCLAHSSSFMIRKDAERKDTESRAH